jgi:protocatechuate 3,4-dioxygenase beta subunit
MRPRRIASRRAVLRAGLATPPALLIAAWAGPNAIPALWPSRSVTAAASAAQEGPSCVVTPALTDGPYFVDEKLFRWDIRDDPATGEVQAGVPLRLGFRVWNVTDGACGPLAGAAVDVWHCNAAGVYSDAVDPGFNTKGLQYLRGAQYTDDTGYAEFLTVYPGWYQGRAVHIHFKVRTDPFGETGYEFTSQVFFDEALTDTVHAQEPYASKGYRTLLNDGDNIYQQSGGQLTLQAVADGDGYARRTAPHHWGQSGDVCCQMVECILAHRYA